MQAIGASSPRLRQLHLIQTCFVLFLFTISLRPFGTSRATHMRSRTFTYTCMYEHAGSLSRIHDSYMHSRLMRR